MSRSYVARPSFSVLIVLAALSLAGCGGAASRYASHMERGKHYLAEKNLDKAGVEFRNALQIEPKAAEALYLSGQVAELRGSIRTAFNLYESALDAQPELIAARASLARIYVAGGLPDRAVALVEPALVAHPNAAELFVVRGGARVELKNLDGARADAERALHLDPGNERAVALLAGLERGAGDFPGAIALVNDAVRRSPTSVQLREVLASLYFDANKPDGAQQQLRKLIELRPHEPRYWYQLARYLTRTHELDAAQHVLEDCIRANPDSDEPKLALVDFISQQRSAAQGESALRNFIAQMPSDYDLRLGLGALLQRRGVATDALRTYTEVAELDSDGPHGLAARDRMGEIYASQGHYEAAQQLIAVVLKKNARDDDALLLRGKLAAERNDPVAAIRDLRAVLRERPEATGVRRTLAHAYLVSGEPALAEEALRTAIDAAPAEVGARLELAQLLAQTNRADQAVTLLEDTVKLAPTDPEAREALIRGYMAKGDLAAARTAVEDLKVLRPQSPAAFYLAGQIAQADKRLDDSEKEFEQALRLQPSAIDALTAVVYIELARGRSALAIARVQSIVDSDPKNPLPANLLGELYLKTGDFQHAETMLARASALAPKWWVPYRNRALVQIELHDMAGAIKAYEAGLGVAPTQPDLAVELAALDEKGGRIDDAIARIDALYKSNSRSQAIANNLAKLLVTYKSDQQSLNRARDLTAPFASSDNGALLDTNGWVQFRRGDYATALPVLERAAQRDPRSKEIRYHVAMAELRAGERERARSNLEFALAAPARFVGVDNARTVLASLEGRST